ncbi:enoyl-CoA hydratase/isomerase family protein, partial [bacterium]|nr:enoyl-CoA hydratase/isomerase family protein [bacterium]
MTVNLTWEPTGKVAWLTLDSPPGNILDKKMMTALSEALLALEAKRPWAVVMRGEGENFCYGASVEEHLPDRVDDMLFTFTELLRQMVHFPAVTIASARGLCLGGGLELALGCDRIVLHTEAKVGLPEICLGVFPPAGLALLPLRAGDGAVA